MRPDFDAGSAHDPGSRPAPVAIQPHGALLAIDAEGRIARVAGNTRAAFGRAPEDLVGSPLAAVFDGAGTFASAWPPDAPTRPRHLARKSGERGRWDVAVHRAGHYTVVEFEPAPADEPDAATTLAKVQRAGMAIEAADDVRALCQACAQAIHELSGFDRVCVHRFAAERGLDVMASVAPASWLCAEDAPRFAPPEATRVHAIPDLDYAPAPVLPPQPQDGGLDLRRAILHGMASAPRRRLRRQGVAAVLSLPILVRGRSWGIVSCHHATPRLAPAAMRASCELIVRLGALRLEALDRQAARRDAALPAQATLVVQEAHHRVQNSLQIVASMLRLEARRTDHVQARAHLGAAAGRLAAVGAAHRQLSQPSAAQGVPLDRYLDELCRDLARSWGDAWIDQITVDVCPASLTADATVTLGLLVAELLTNAVKYAYRGAPGPIGIEARNDGHWLQVTVRDVGHGIPQDGAGSGLGSRLTRAFATQLGGRIDVSSGRQGTTATICIPLSAIEQSDDSAEPTVEVDAG